MNELFHRLHKPRSLSCNNAAGNEEFQFCQRRCSLYSRERDHTLPGIRTMIATGYEVAIDRKKRTRCTREISQKAARQRVTTAKCPVRDILPPLSDMTDSLSNHTATITELKTMRFWPLLRNLLRTHKMRQRKNTKDLRQDYQSRNKDPHLA